MRSIPLPLAKLVARCGDVFTKLTGKNFPLTSTRLDALLETTHFSCQKLIETGFKHPQTTRDGIAEMLKAERGKLKTEN